MRVQSLYSGLSCRVLCVLLAFVTATGPTAAVLGQEGEIKFNTRPPKGDADDEPVVEQPVIRRLPNDTTLIASPDAGKLDVEYLTPKSVAYLSLRPHQFLTSPNAALFPIEVASAAGLQHLGIDPVDIAEVIAFVEPPTVMGVSYGLVVKFLKPIRGSDIPEKLRAHTQPGELAGKKYLQSADPRLPSLYMVDPQTLLVMPDMTLQRVLAESATPPTSPLIEHIREIPTGSDLFLSVDVESLRPLINPWINVAVMQQRDKFPEEAKPFLAIPDLVKAVDLTFNLSHPGPTALVLHANDAASVDRLRELYDLAIELQRKQMTDENAKLQQSDDPVERALGSYMERVSKVTADAYAPQIEGSTLVVFQIDQTNDTPQNQLVVIAVAGILVALLLPAIQAAREAARRSLSLNNMRQIMLAMFVYADAKKTFPPHAIYSEDGKPLLSWRVAILPYLDQQELYNQFKLDEPWDSEHNRALIEHMPEVYSNPNIGEPGKTNYLAVVGSGCVLDGSAEGIGFARITDGTSNTIVVVEADADRAVEWTKPDDLEFDPNNPTAGFGHLRPDGFNAVWADGHVSFLSNELDPQTVKAFLTRNGGERVDVP